MRNLNRLILLVALFCIAGATQAQISIGPKVGINFGTFRGDDVASEEAEMILGVQLGFAAEIGVTDHFSILPELLFFQKGAEQTFGEDIFGDKIETETVLNYFEIPILAKYAFELAESTDVFVTAGPSFGIGLGGKVKQGDQETDIEFEDDGFTNFDVGFSIGGGAQFEVGPGNLFVEIRYLLGLTSIDDSAADLDIKNNGIGISAGFLYPLSK